MRRFSLYLVCSSLFLLSLCSAFNEERVATISFTGTAGRVQLEEGKNYFSSAQQDSVSFDVCRFYVTDVQVLSGEKVIGQVKVHLVDLFDSASTVFKVVIGPDKITGLRFNLGVDSLTNIAGVGSGDLDPTNGMYWAWQSGYINLKLEGHCKQCTSTHGEFNYHLGGYAGENYCMQTVELPAANARMDVRADVMRVISTINMKQTPHVMSPGPGAVELSKSAARMFYLQR